MKNLIILIFCTLLLPVATQASSVSGTAGTPEIPAGAAPIVVAGILGAVLLVRNFRGKGKKD